MDKEKEIQDLKEKLESTRAKIRGELNKIDALKLKLKTAYRRRDRAKYEEERSTILKNLNQFESELHDAERKLAELEASP